MFTTPYFRHSGHSANGERSPSTKQRALPDIPAGEDGVYDQLERNLPPHQMKAKSSESTSVKNKPPKMVIQVSGFLIKISNPDRKKSRIVCIL